MDGVMLWSVGMDVYDGMVMDMLWVGVNWILVLYLLCVGK